MMTTASTGAITTSLPRSRWNGPTAQRVVPADVDLEQPERDRGGGDGRQVGEPAEHQRSERAQQHGQADG